MTAWRNCYRSVLPKAIYRFNAIPIKIAMTYFTDIEQTFQNFIWNHKWPWVAATILRKKNKVRGITIHDIKLYYKATVIKTVWYWHKSRTESMEQNRKPRNKPTSLWSINIRQRGRNIEWNQNSIFNKWCWEIWTATCKIVKLDHQLTPYTKINSRDG